MKKLYITLLALPLLVNAQSTQDSATRLNTLLNGVKQLQADFVQTTQANGKKQTLSGTMAASRPNKFRWEIKAPASQLIVANGATMWVYDPDLKQATKQSASNQLGDTPALLLSGNPVQIAQNFSVKQPDVRKNYFILTPKNANSGFVNLGISFNGGKPVMMVLKDNLGQTTSIKFSNVKNTVSASAFEFSPPKGVDIINQ